MFEVLTADSYRGYSAPLHYSEDGAAIAQPSYIGRLVWPGTHDADDVVVKPYVQASCGVGNEAIGYAANHLRGVRQPEKAAVLLLSIKELPNLGVDWTPYIDITSGLAACWVTSLERDAKPFKYVRRLASFSSKQVSAFYKSNFCKVLATVDHVTGNNDRHQGNFLYLDDLAYVAIDQGCVGGGPHWHTTWPEASPLNQLVRLVDENLTNSESGKWKAEAILEHEKSQSAWPSYVNQIQALLPGLLSHDSIETIVEYMAGRASGSHFASTCGKLV